MGSALRTISLRLRGTSTKELSEAGEETDSAITSKSKLRSKIKSLSGIDILTDSGAYKSTYEILLEISKVWKDMSDIDQAALLEIIAGKTRSNTAAAILSNTTDLENAYVDALHAEGSALRENEKYLDSIQGRIDLFTNSVQTMWSNALDDDAVKLFVNIGTQLVKFVDNLGLIKTLVISIGTYLIKKNFNGDLFGGLFGDKTQSMSQIKSTMESLKKARDDAAKSLIGDEGNKFKQKKLNQAESTLAAYEKSMGPELQKYNNLIEQQKIAQENLNAAQHEFIKATRDGVDTTTLEAYGNNVKNAENELKNVEIELKKVEIQADATGTAGMTAGQKFKTGFKTAGKAVLQFGKELLKSMATAYVITTVLELIRKLGEVGKYVLGQLVETPEEAQEKFEELNSELSDVKSELSSLRSELDSTQDRIDELISQGTLSFTEQEELDRLRAENDELERKIKLNESLEKTKQKTVNEASINATDKYLSGTSFASDISKTEKQETWKENGETFGKAVGLILGGVITAAIIGASGGTLTPAALMIGSAVGGISFGALGGVAGSGLAGAAYNSEQTVGEALDNMVAKRKELQKIQDEALTNNDVEAYNKATEALQTYDEQMAKHISQIQQNYNAMDWDTATEDQKKKMIEYADWLDKYSISMGADGAKSNAIERIFGGKEASLQLKNIDKQIKEAVKSGEEIDFYEMFNSDGLKDTKERLKELGISITDLKYYYLDWKEAEEEVAETNLYGVAQDINSITDSLDSLKSAFEEIQEQGFVTAKTITELNATFSSCEDAWDNYVNKVMSGTASTEEMKRATEELADAFISDKLTKGPLNTTEKIATMMQLYSMGIENAREYLEDSIDESAWNKISSNISDMIKQAYSADISESDARKYLDPEYQKEQAAAILDEYGIEYTNDQLEEYVNLLIEKAKAQRELNDLEANHTEYQRWKDRNEELEALINEYEELLDDFNPNEWIVDSSTDTVYKINPDETYTDPMTLDEFNELQRKYQELQSFIDEKADLEVKLKAGDISDEEKKNLEDRIAEIDEQIENGITADIQMKLEVIDKSKAIDDIQSIYDTLIDAAQEYNENGGYMTVDTLQSLLEIDSEYLAALSIENGQLVLNKQALQDIAKARIYDMAIKKIDNMLELASSYAKAGNIEKLNELIGVYSTATGTMQDYNKELLTTIQNELLAQGYSSTDVEGYITSLESKANNILSWAEGVANNLDSTLSSSGNTAASETETALERLQKRYERQISNLDNQQTYLQNQVDRLEAEHKGISKQYYEDQIAIEQQKLNLYQQERSELLSLLNSTAKGTDEWYEVADAIWETEHNIQEATLNMIEFRQSIIDLYKTAFDDLANAHSNKDDFLSDQQNYIDKYLELLDLQGEVASASGYQEQIAAEQKKMANNVVQLNNLRELLADGMSTGYIKEGSEEWIDMQDQIREVEAAILDNKIALEEYNNELKNLAVEAFNLVRDAFSNKDDFFTTQQDYIEGYIDYLEAIGVDAPEAIYEKLIEIEQEKRKNTLADLVDARQGFKDIEAKGYTAADEEWQDAYSQITELEKKIQDSDIAMAQWEQTIRELNFDKFDRFISRLDDLNSEIEHLRGLMDNEDVAFEDGTWTEEGITSLGLLYQQMQLNQEKSQEYAQKIDELNEEYSKGSMSEQEYYEQLQKLKEGQWDSIEAYEDAKDAIVDMEEARIDMVEKGINEEIDAYQELIKLKQDELQSERD